MSINVNVQIARALPRVSEEGLTLAIFKNARLKETTANLVRVNSVAQLAAAFTAPDNVQAFKELYTAEYLLNRGVNLLCYQTVTVGTIATSDITAVSDVEVLNYKFVVIPYSFVSYSTGIIWDSEVGTLVSNNDIELLLDLDPFISTADAALISAALDSSKISLFVNSGFTSNPSNFTPVGSIDVSKELIADPTVYVASTDYVGIPASAAVLVKRINFILKETPWLPVAGETYGIVDFASLFRKISTIEKTAFQAANINPLVNKIGVGNLLVSQNTMFKDEAVVKTNPLFRAHVVTEALWIKRKLGRIAYSALQLPNSRRTWDMLSLKVKTLFNKILSAEGVEDYSVLIGKGITMTAEDISGGIIKLAISYLPIRVIESVVIDVMIQESENTYDIGISGGDL